MQGLVFAVPSRVPRFFASAHEMKNHVAFKQIDLEFKRPIDEWHL